MLRAGNKIDSFTLVKELGKGGFGVVWLAEERTIFASPRVALKIALEDNINLEAIKQEANMWVQASGHINVLPIFGVRICDEHVVIISEYVPDGSLEDWLNQHGGKASSIEAAVDMATGILAGLEHLHSKGIIHRDLKPANILLQGETPRLTDFGLARLLKSNAQSMNVGGTLPYMAPEVFGGERSEQTDVWAAGVIFYQLLAGSLPFPQQDVRSLIIAIDTHDPLLPSSVPSVLTEIIAKALRKQPAQRYKSATEMRKELRAASRALMMPKQDEQKIPVPSPKDEIQRELQPLATTTHSPAVPLDRTLPMPPSSAPTPDVQPEQRTPEQAQPTPKSKKVWLITVGFIFLLLISVLTIAVIKKLYSQQSKQEPLSAVEAKKLEDAKLHAELAKVWRDRSEWAQAESEYRKAILSDANNTDYRLKLAYSLEVQGKKEEGQSEYREVERLARESLRTEPGKAANHFYLGVSLSEQDKYAEGEAGLREAIRLNPNDSDYRRELGLTLYSQGKYAEAEVEGREAIRLNPDYYRHHTLLGAVLTKEEKYVEAEAELREAIRLNPSYGSSYTNLGDALIGQKKYSEAETAYRVAIKSYSINPHAHAGLGYVLAIQKKYAEAESEYTEAARLFPNEAFYRDKLADFLIERKRYVEAEAASREVIRLKPNEGEYHNDLAIALEYQKKYAAAEVEYREAVRLNPTEAVYRNNLSGILSTQKKYDDAEAIFKEAISLYPDEPAHRYNLGSFLFNRKRYDEAGTSLREAIRLDTDDDASHNYLGVVLEHQEKYAEAEVEFREAVRLNPDEPLYHTNLGISLSKQRKRVAAEAEYKEAKRLMKK